MTTGVSSSLSEIDFDKYLEILEHGKVLDRLDLGSIENVLVEHHGRKVILTHNGVSGRIGLAVM